MLVVGITGNSAEEYLFSPGCVYDRKRVNVF